MSKIKLKSAAPKMKTKRLTFVSLNYLNLLLIKCFDYEKNSSPICLYISVNGM